MKPLHPDLRVPVGQYLLKQREGDAGFRFFQAPNGEHSDLGIGVHQIQFGLLKGGLR